MSKMQPQLITLAQLNSDHLFDSGTKGFRVVLARDDLGDVKVWYSHQGAWSSELGVDGQCASAVDFADLIVLGEPKVVATKMVTELAFGRGVFESPISMTLAHGLNRAHHWDIKECSEKVEMIDRLNGVQKSSFQCLEYDRFHFSSILINDLLSAIDETIRTRDWLNFVEAVERLDAQDALKINPIETSSDWWTP